LKKFFLAFFCTLFLLTACSTHKLESKPQPNNDLQQGISEYLQILCSDKMAGREGGTRGEAEAALYLAKFLQEKGLKPAGEGKTYFQAFSINGYRPTLSGKRMAFYQDNSLPKKTSENVLAILEGRTEEVIVISAHYDHLGIINGELYPGANDNASGVSVVLEIINGLAGQRPEKTILFAFWGSEEKGLWGSRYFCAQPTIPWERIKCMINFDTVGNLEQKILLGWLGSENQLTQEIVEGLEEQGWQISWEDNSKHSSDHFPFAKKGIPSFTLLSPTWLEKNHTPLDTVKEIKIKPLEDLAHAFVHILK
jgi:aminopeptidase YwaD